MTLIQTLATRLRERYPEILVRVHPSGFDVSLDRKPSPVIFAAVVLARDEIHVHTVGTAQRPACCPVDDVGLALDAVSAIVEAYVTDEYEPAVHSI